MQGKSYDMIVLGAGAAGLSLLSRLVESGWSRDKKILLVDRSPKTTNDRTWCFWEEKPGFFESLVYHQWNNLQFMGNGWQHRLDIQPYRYKMIRGIDFYRHCMDQVSRQSNIDILYGEIRLQKERGKPYNIWLDGEEFLPGNALLFSSIYQPEPSREKEIHLLQHFKGWFLETPTDFFDPGRATLMDFRVHQEHGTSFVYVLPFTPRSALVEYTQFTASLLEPDQYRQELQFYCSEVLGLGDYRIIEEEFGVIPMTNRIFPFYENGIYHIGTAGGATKASTGYTFQFIQRQTEAIVERLQQGMPLNGLHLSPRRFHFYDSVLLYLLEKNRPGGREIFTRLFERNRASRIFRFLDNNTTLAEELKIIGSLQFLPFLRSALKQLIP